MNDNNNSKEAIKYLNKLFKNIKTKYILGEKLKYEILKEFYDNTILNDKNNLITYSKKKNENLITNYLLDAIIKKICRIIKKHENSYLCCPFMKVFEFVFSKLNTNETFILYNLSNDQSLSFIASMTHNINKVIQYVDEEFEINSIINNKKIEYVTYNENIFDIDLQLNDKEIAIIDCSKISSKNIYAMSDKLNNLICISFGKKLFQNNKWKTHRINQYDISIFIHFNIDKFSNLYTF